MYCSKWNRMINLDLCDFQLYHWNISAQCVQVFESTAYPKKYAHGFCFAVLFRGYTFPYPSGLLHWHCGNLTIAPVPAKQPWWIWINTSCEFIMNDCITTTKQSTTKPCAYVLGYTVLPVGHRFYEYGHVYDVYSSAVLDLISKHVHGIMLPIQWTCHAHSLLSRWPSDSIKPYPVQTDNRMSRLFPLVHKFKRKGRDFVHGIKENHGTWLIWSIIWDENRQIKSIISLRGIKICKQI